MNRLFLFSIVFSVLFTAGSTLATVGGPTFIHTFKYNPVDESVYYIQNNLNGRGCPPELMKLSLNSGKVGIVYSCDEGEKLIEDNGYQFFPVNIEINKVIENFKFLTPINLKDNKISVDVNFVDYKYFESEIIRNANFIASVYQNNKKIIDFPVSGCNLEQPFIFAGYAIPGFDKKIVLLLSTKGDCMEGGYIYESLHVVGGVDNLDKKYYPNFYKETSALVPNEGTLVVFESESVNNKTEEKDNSANSKDVLTDRVILYTILGSLVALGIGYFLGKKSIK